MDAWTAGRVSVEAKFLLLYGVNHRSANVAQREALAFTHDECARVLVDVAGARPGDEALVLATCNRTECYMVSADPDAAYARLRTAVLRVRDADLMAPGAHLYASRDGDAVRHLFRVATGLDSMVLGDVQVLGQVKRAYALAQEAGTAGRVIERLLARALHTGKRSRRETAVGTGAVSVGSAAVELLRHELGSLAHRYVLVIGAGKTGRLIARHLVRQDAAHVTVTNRSDAAAETLAAEVGGRVLPLDQLRRGLLVADAVVTATSADVPLIEAVLARDVMEVRQQRPLLIVDVAVPRNVEPSVAYLPGVTLRDIDSLQSIVDRGLTLRLAAVPHVERIVEEELQRFEVWRRGLAAAPVVRELRDHFERVRLEELDRMLKHATEAERDHAERITRTLVNRLLHMPTVALKDLDPVSDAGRSRLQAARELFALGRQSPRRRYTGAF
jgi:glutamyl-tRNA reductase